MCKGTVVKSTHPKVTLSAKIKEAVGSGQKYFRFAVQLKQVSHFYNHMSEAILPYRWGVSLPSSMLGPSHASYNFCKFG